MGYYMRKKIMNQKKVKAMNEESRVFGYCSNCGSKITDDIEEYYCDEEGNLLCSHDCVLEYFCVNVMEV